MRPHFASLRAHVVLLCLFCCAFTANSQTPDESFTPFFAKATNVRVMRKLADDKMLIAGDFQGIWSAPYASDLIRLNADGTVDDTFVPEINIVGTSVQDIAIQSDGKILISGNFRGFDGRPFFNILRLNPDGSVDETFAPAIHSTLNYSQVSGMLVLPDGRILCLGYFGYLTDRENIALLNADGSMDESFLASIDLGGASISMNVLDDDRILLAGDFNMVSDTTVNGIAVINTKGFLDKEFLANTGSATTDQIYAAAVQSTGKILLGGSFISFNSVAAQKVVRLNADGTVDNTFTANAGFNTGNHVTALKVLADDRIVVGGNFQTPKKRIMMLTADGAPDNTFNPGSGLETNVSIPEVFDIDINSGDQIIFSGYFNRYNGEPILSLARVALDGTLDLAFKPNPAAIGSVESVYTLPDGKILAGGSFVMVNDDVRNGLVKLNPDGSLDPTFNIGTGFSSPVVTVAGLSDGDILVGGYFNSYDGVVVNGLVRLNPDGSRDATFTTAVGRNHSTAGIYAIHVQSDGKIILGGDFHSINGTSIKNLARLNSDGTLDTDFHTARTDFPELVLTIDERPSDGKLIVTERDFSTPYVKLLNPDGSIDTNFDGASKFQGPIYQARFLPDGRIILGGNQFTAFGSTNLGGTVVLDDAAEISPGFNLTPGFGTLLPGEFLFWNDHIVTGGIYQHTNLPEPATYLRIMDAGGANYSDVVIKGHIYDLAGGGTDTLYVAGVVRKAGDTDVAGLTRLIVEPQPLNAPSSLQASVKVAYNVRLTWTANTTSEQSFEIQRSKDNSSNFSTVGFTSPDSTGFTDANGLVEETLYYYRVRGTSLGGSSSFSNEVSITTLPKPPVAPSNVTASNQRHNTIDIKWKDNSEDETGFIIYKSLDFTPVTVALDTIPANDTTYTVTGLEHSTWHYFFVRAYNAGGVSNYAYVSSATRDLPPSAPDSLALSEHLEDRIILTWRDNSEPGFNENNFVVYRSESDTLHYVILGYTAQNGTVFTDYSVEPGKDYYYKVAGIRNLSESDYSNHLLVEGKISGPSNVVAVALSMSTIKLTWSDTLSSETGFKVYSYYDEAVLIASLPANTTSYIVDSLEFSTYFAFRVTATDETTESFPVAVGTMTLSLSAGDWETKTVSGIPARSHAVGFAIDGQGYVGLGKSELGLHRDFWRYDPGSNQWTEIASFPGSARSGAVAFVVANKAYVGTGMDSVGYPLDFYAYDPVTDAWTPVADYPENFNSAGGTYGAIAFTIGDYGYAGLGNTGVNNTTDFFRYNPANDVWEARASFGGAGRVGAAAFASGTVGYVAMGSTGLSKSKEFWQYNPELDQWYQLGDYTGEARSGVTGFMINNEGFVCAGLEGDFFGSTATRKLSAYTIHNTWLDASEMPGEERSYATSFVIGNRGYIFSGTDGSAPINDLHVFKPGSEFIPDRPTGIQPLYHTSTAIRVTWNDVSDNETGFKVFAAKNNESHQEVADVAQDAEELIISGLEPNTLYRVYVQAFNNYGVGNSFEVNAYTYMPETPENLAATATTPREVQLTWEDKSAEETDFRVYRGEGNGPLSFRFTVPANQTEIFDNDDLQPVTLYRYALAASHNFGGTSALSDTVTVTTPLATPFALSATLVGVDTIELEWQHEDATVQFDIYRAEDGGSYAYRASSATMTFTDPELLPQVSYSYQVRAKNILGTTSAFSVAAGATTPNIIPKAPTNVVMDPSVTSDIRISWTDNSSNESGFVVSRKIAGGQYEQVATVDANVTEYIGTIEVETSYVFAVSAKNELGESAKAEVEVFVQPEIPAGPTLVTATYDEGVIHVSWTDNSAYETSFEIAREDKGEDPFTSVAKDITSFDDEDVQAGTFTYTYKVRSKNGKGVSEWSLPVSIDVTLVITDAEKEIPNSVTATPNPVTDVLVVKNHDQNARKFSIVDVHGRELTASTLAGGEEKVISAAHWASGIYLLRIEGDKMVKIVKE